MRDRFNISRAAYGLIAGAHAIVAGLHQQACLAEMVGEQFRLLRDNFTEIFLQRIGNALVPLAPAHQQQALISGVPHQRMLETEAPLQAAFFGKDNSRRHQFCQHALEFAGASGATASSSENENCRPITAAIWATSRAPPRRSSRAISESLSVAGTGVVLAGRFHHALGQLLDEQRNAVSLGDDRGDRVRRQAVRRRDTGDQLRAFLAAEPAERQQRRMRPRQPRRHEIGPRRHHRQQPRLSDAVDQPRHHLERGGVDPVRVLQHDQHRIAVADAREHLDDQGQGRGLALRRCQRRRRCAAIGIDSSSASKRPRMSSEAVRRANTALEFLDPRVRHVGRRKTGARCEILDHGIKRAVAVIGRALQMDARMRLGAQVASCSASIERDFPMPASPITVTIWPSPWRASRQRSSISPISCARPISGRLSPAADRGKTAFDRRFATHLPGRHRAGKAFQFVLAGMGRVRTARPAIAGSTR